MASPSETFSQEAYVQAKQGVVKAVADNLRNSRALLVTGGYITTPPEPNWDALAQEAINNRSIAGVPLSQFPPDKDGRPLDSVVPTPQRIDLIAREVAEGVRENTGDMEMLKGATIGQAFSGFFAMIQEKGFGAALSAIFNMIFGDGQSEDAKDLQRFIGQETAGAIGNGVTARLRARQGELGLSNEQINQIGQQSQDAVRTRVGLPPLAPQAPQQPGVAGNLTPAENSAVLNAIEGQVLNSLGLQRQQNGELVSNPANATGTERLNAMAMAAGVPNNQFTGEQKTAIARTMTGALHSVATSNPPVREPAQIRDMIRTQLKDNAAAMGLGNMPEADRNAMLQMMANEMTTSYLKARPIDRAAGEAFEASVAGENANIKRQLMVGRIRPAVVSGLGLAENPPGTLTTLPREPNQPARQIETLEQVAGRPLTNDQRGAIVNTMTDALSHVASNNISNPNDIRDEFKRRLEAKATEMGFGHLSAEDKNRLFTVMANESTVNYLKTAVSQQAADAFKAAKQGETDRMTGELSSGRVRQGMFDALAPAALQGVEDNVIAEIRKQRTALDTAPYPEPVNTQLKNRMDELLRDDRTPEGRAKLLSFAGAMGGPNQNQREAMARHTAEAMTDELMKPENRGKSKEELAPLLEAAVKARLTAKRDEIQATNPRFRMTDEIINSAGAATATATRNMKPEEHAQIVQAQGLINHNAPQSTAPLVFNIPRASAAAQTMPAVVDPETIRRDIRSQVRTTIVTTIDQKIRDGAAEHERTRWAYEPRGTVENAIRYGRAPNNSQRDHIAAAVSEETANIMTDPSIPPEQKAERTRLAVIARLQRDSEFINKEHDKGGLANTKLYMVSLTDYKWQINDNWINEIANGARDGVNTEMSRPGRADQIRQLAPLLTPIQVDAPRLPIPTPAPAAAPVR